MGKKGRRKRWRDEKMKAAKRKLAGSWDLEISLRSKMNMNI